MKIFKDKNFQNYNFNFILTKHVKNKKKIQKYLKCENFKKIRFDQNFQKNLHNSDFYGSGGASLMMLLFSHLQLFFQSIKSHNCSNINVKN